MKKNLDLVARTLATDSGGFTLWVGAGCSIALTNGATPGWSQLIRQLAKGGSLEDFEPTGEYPTDVERLSEAISHATFRRELRQRLVDLVPSHASTDIAIQQAVLGSRAGTIVSFNLEFFSAFPLTAIKCGSQFVSRTFRERSPYAMDLTPNVGGGVVSPPVYFPHGLLHEGSIVMTKSEYDRHQGSIAVSTAVHLAIGGDLVVLGMSLGDVYLRDAILQNRRWIRNIYWISERFDHLEWARVANVTLVECVNSEVWKTLSDAILDQKEADPILKAIPKLREEFPRQYLELQKWPSLLRTKLHEFGSTLLSRPEFTTDQVTLFAQHCVDVGLDVPQSVLDDPRCLL